MQILNRFFRPKLIVGALPVTLLNGTTADATQVMSDLNWVVNQVNANAAPLASPTFTGIVTTAALNATNITASGTLAVTTGAAVGGATPGTGGLAFPATAVAVADANTLDDYDEYTAAAANCSGAIAASAVWRLTKSGNMVTLELPAVTGAGTAVADITFGTLLPAKYRPPGNVIGGAVSLTDNGASVATPGVVSVATNGTIVVYKNMLGTTAFTVTATCGINTRALFSYLV